MKDKYYMLKVIIIGIITGLCNGLFGSGGGIIVVPAMVHFLNISEHDSHATAIAIILPLAVISSFIYFRNGYLDMSIVIKVAAGGIIGGMLGAWLLHRVPSYWLRKTFALFIIAAAVRMIIQMVLFIIGLLSGMISGMGIGGGSILIPALIFIAGTAQHTAQSVNLTSFIPTALVAVYIHSRNKHVKFKLALHLILAGSFGAVMGSILASSIAAEVLKRMFGLFLLVMGLYEFFRKDKNKSKI